MSLVLVGLMGAGKSSVGRLAATRLRWEFVDVDVAITARTGSTVRQIWEDAGEAAYRGLESAVVLETLSSTRPSVLAAPGGVVLDAQVRKALQEAFVVWLRAGPATLAGRVQPGDHRPLLGDDPLPVLDAMATERAHLYREVSNAVIDTGELGAATVADQVVDLVVEHCQLHPTTP
jgi:shikimate kinase